MKGHYSNLYVGILSKTAVMFPLLTRPQKAQVLKCEALSPAEGQSERGVLLVLTPAPDLQGGAWCSAPCPTVPRGLESSLWPFSRPSQACSIIVRVSASVVDLPYEARLMCVF